MIPHRGELPKINDFTESAEEPLNSTRKKPLESPLCQRRLPHSRHACHSHLCLLHAAVFGPAIHGEPAILLDDVLPRPTSRGHRLDNQRL